MNYYLNELGIALLFQRPRSVDTARHSSSWTTASSAKMREGHRALLD